MSKKKNSSASGEMSFFN